MANSSQSSTKPKRVRRNRTQEILETATRLFAEYGYQGATLAQVAEAVGLTEAGVLHYFPSKTQLLQGVLEYHEQQDVEIYSNLIKTAKMDAAGVFQVLEEVVAQNEQIPGLIQLFTVLVSESIRSDHPSHQFFVERYRQGREQYFEKYFSMLATPIRKDVNLDELAALIMAVMDGLQIQWLLDPGKVDMLAAFKLFSRIIVDYLER